MSRRLIVRFLAPLLALLLLAPQALANKVISLAGEATDIIFALGAEDSLVAVDATSNYPEAANDLPNIGYHGRLSAEALLAFGPTLVIANNQAGPAEVLEQLEAAGVQVVHIGDAPVLETAMENVRTVAALVGAEAEGERLAAALETQLAEVATRASLLDPKPRVLFLYLGSATMQFAAGDATSSNAMIEAAGGVDVGKEIGFVGNVPFTPEAIVAAAPDVIVVTERGINVMGSVEAVTEIPGVSETPAAKAGNVIVFEDGYFLNLGLRSGDALEELVDYFYSLR